MGFTEVDALILPDHSALNAEDKCLFLREYNVNAGFESDTYSLIWNLKKKPSERLIKQGWHHKARCINQVSQEFRAALNPEWLKNGTLVPVPSSKVVGHPDYDDRMEQICRGIRPDLDVRCLGSGLIAKT